MGNSLLTVKHKCQKSLQNNVIYISSEIYFILKSVYQNILNKVDKAKNQQALLSYAFSKKLKNLKRKENCNSSKIYKNMRSLSKSYKIF